MNYKAPRGTRDILPEEAAKWQYLEAKYMEFCKLYGFGEIRTPIFEQTELFARSVGEESDIVSKEMYSFQDRSGRELTLRPELTAAVAGLTLSTTWVKNRSRSSSLQRSHVSL
jgi:histidyl-tRNA synthetase